MNPNEPADKLTKRDLLFAAAFPVMLEKFIDPNASDWCYKFTAHQARRAVDAAMAELSATEFCEWTWVSKTKISVACCGRHFLCVQDGYEYCPYCAKPIRVKETQ